MMSHIEAIEKIGEWLDGDLSPDEELALTGHLESCRACQDELGEITELRERARALPREIAPTHDLWPEVAARIDDHKVISFEPRQSTRVAMNRGMLAAAAILLVVVSSGITAWLVGNEPAQPEFAEAPAATASTGTTALAAFRPTEQEYLSTVAELRAVLDARRDLLEPQTVAVIERNLSIIDAAIADSRAALEADPANAGLPLTLSDMYRRKVDLLSTAIQLPAQT